MSFLSNSVLYVPFLGKYDTFEKNPKGSWHYSDFQFIISNKLDYAENVVEDTIIYEMIHYLIFSNQLQDNAQKVSSL